MCSGKGLGLGVERKPLLVWDLGVGLEEYCVVVAVALAMMLKDVFRIPPLLFVFFLLEANPTWVFCQIRLKRAGKPPSDFPAQIWDGAFPV